MFKYMRTIFASEKHTRQVISGASGKHIQKNRTKHKRCLDMGAGQSHIIRDQCNHTTPSSTTKGNGVYSSRRQHLHMPGVMNAQRVRAGHDSKYFIRMRMFPKSGDSKHRQKQNRQLCTHQFRSTQTLQGNSSQVNPPALYTLCARPQPRKARPAAGQAARARHGGERGAHEGEGRHIPAAANFTREDEKPLWPTGRELWIPAAFTLMRNNV